VPRIAYPNINFSQTFKMWSHFYQGTVKCKPPKKHALFARTSPHRHQPIPRSSQPHSSFVKSHTQRDISLYYICIWHIHTDTVQRSASTSSSTSLVFLRLQAWRPCATPTAASWRSSRPSATRRGEHITAPKPQHHFMYMYMYIYICDNLWG